MFRPQTAKNPPTSLAGISDQVMKAVQLATGILFVGSVIYDYTFLTSLELSFHEVPTSLSEHVRSAVIWSPLLLVVFAGAMAVQYAVMKMTGWALGKNSAARGDLPEPRQGSTLRSETAKAKTHGIAGLIVATGRLALLGLVVIGLVFAFVWLVRKADQVGPRNTLAILGSAWVGIAGILVPRISSIKQLGTENPSAAFNLAFLITYVPGILVMAGLYGFDQGAGLLTETGQAWTMTLRDGNAYVVCNVSGFRRYEEVTIVVDPTPSVLVGPTLIDAQRRVRLIPSKMIERAERFRGNPLLFRNAQSTFTAAYPPNCRAEPANTIEKGAE